MTRAVPFTNEFGQVIEVGQKVAYVICRTGARQKSGKYIGLSPSGGVTIEIMRDNYRWVPAEKDYVGRTMMFGSVLKRIDNTPYMAKTILQNNYVFPL